jgi:hypothetical protein
MIYHIGDTLVWKYGPVVNARIEGDKLTIIEWRSSDSQPSQEDVDKAVEEYRAHWEKTEEYREQRKAKYAAVEDQLDMQYWDAVNDTTSWADHISAVKAAHPKPE